MTWKRASKRSRFLIFTAPLVLESIVPASFISFLEGTSRDEYEIIAGRERSYPGKNVNYLR